MRDYEEKSFYEIQLDNKQLILVFLAGVTVCVLIFVLGVMVGKGKKEAEMASIIKTESPIAAKPQEDKQVPAEAKPIIEEKAKKENASAKDQKAKNEEDYSFYDLDKSDSETKLTKKEEVKPSVAPEKKPAPEKPKPEEAKADETSEPVAVSNPASTTPPVESPAASGSQRYTVQVMATASKSKAEVQLSALQAKGYTAYMDEDKGNSGSVYKVRVGKYSDSDSAKRVASKLKEELKLETWVAVLD